MTTEHRAATDEISVEIAQQVRHRGASESHVVAATQRIAIAPAIVLESGMAVFLATATGFRLEARFSSGRLVLTRNGIEVSVAHPIGVPFDCSISWTPNTLSVAAGEEAKIETTPPIVPPDSLVEWAKAREQKRAEVNAANEGFSVKMQVQFTDLSKPINLMSAVNLPGLAPPQGQLLTDIAATCRVCGLVYPSQAAYDIGGPGAVVDAVEYEGSIPGMALGPRCGGQGTVGEIYGVLEEGLLRMTGSGRTLGEVATLIQILRGAIEREDTDPIAVITEIKERLPEQTETVAWLTRHAPLGKFLKEFFVILFLALNLISSRFPPTPKTTVTQPSTPATQAAPVVVEVRPTIEVGPSSADFKAIIAEAAAALKAAAAAPAPAPPPAAAPARNKRIKNRPKRGPKNR